MTRIALLTLVVACIAYTSGCGGSSGGETTTAFTVSIQPTKTVPKTDTIHAGDNVQFLNQTQIAQRVVSGTLTPSGNPQTVRSIVINNVGFSPTDSEADLGDTVRFSNSSTDTFTMDIVNDNGSVVSSLTIPQGRQQDFLFPYAGQFIVRNSNNSLFAGTVTVFGSPNPSNQFAGSVVGNGGTFIVQFPSAGTFPYYIQDPNNPEATFITGTIVVQ